MDQYEFDGVIQAAGPGGGAYVLFPYDPMTCFGKKNQVPIECTIDGIPYRGSIANMGAGACIGILKAIREQLGKGPGDCVHVVVRQDTSPRMIETPPDLATALKDDPAASTAWDKLSYSHKREYVTAITSAKKEETRFQRIQKTVESLAGMKKA